MSEQKAFENIELPPELLRAIEADVERYHQMRINAAKKRLNKPAPKPNTIKRQRRKAMLDSVAGQTIVELRLQGNSWRKIGLIIGFSEDDARAEGVKRELRWKAEDVLEDLAGDELSGDPWGQYDLLDTQSIRSGVLARFLEAMRLKAIQ